MKKLLLLAMALLCFVFLLAACCDEEEGETYAYAGEEREAFADMRAGEPPPLAACGGRLDINAENVEKIELLTLWSDFLVIEKTWSEYLGGYFGLVNTYTDEAHILALINFFNSLTLTTSEIFIDAARPSENFRITYSDGTASYIEFIFTSLFYNDSFFRISDEDRGPGRTRELDNMLYGLHDETKRLK